MLTRQGQKALHILCFLKQRGCVIEHEHVPRTDCCRRIHCFSTNRKTAPGALLTRSYVSLGMVRLHLMYKNNSPLALAFSSPQSSSSIQHSLTNMSSTTQTTTSTHPTIATIGCSDVQDVTVDMDYVKENEAGEQPGYPQLHTIDPAFTTTKKVVIKDVRGSRVTPSLAANGYEYFNLDFDKAIDYTNEEDIKAKWYPQISAVLKEK
jgi:hypothetical protein